MKLMSKLQELIVVLNEINPQLEIHQYNVVQLIMDYSDERGRLLESVIENETLNYNMSVADLQQIVKKTEKNLVLIVKAIEEFRIFLKNEFTFKDNF